LNSFLESKELVLGDESYKIYALNDSVI
jgi:hypothetical protein